MEEDSDLDNTILSLNSQAMAYLQDGQYKASLDNLLEA